MKQIAIYGKGGIGKSTLAANISAALAIGGKKVLQVGCDPKHDSTRILMGGQRITTVLDYLKLTAPDQFNAQDIVFSGFRGIDCVEAGGPEPGVGCAGRGILTAFDLLERLGIKKLGYDMVLYDVLGDVVCGGFAVPIRHEYADVVYIITSGEFMSIYAANNIIKGLKNYDGDGKRIGGIIFNRRGIEDEDLKIARFAQAVNIPIIADFPRSDVFTQAEMQGVPVVQAYPNTPLANRFQALAGFIDGDSALYAACPMSDEELETVVLDKALCPQVDYCRPSQKAIENTLTQKDNDTGFPVGNLLSLNVRRREPLHGCSFNGAVNVTTQVGDAITVAHGPRSCAHASYQTITSIGRKSLFERGVSLPLQIIPPVVSSDMSEGVMVFGGIDQLREKIEEVKQYKPAAVFVITTCPAGIIGDNMDFIENMNRLNDIRIIPVKADGNISGDYLQGMIMANTEIARRIIDRQVEPRDNLVNIIAEKSIAIGTQKNLQVMQELFDAVGVSINCRFICQTTVKELENFMLAPLNILAYDDYMGRMMRSFLEGEFGARFMSNPFPVGFHETEQWLYELARYFGREDRVKDIVDVYRDKYYSEIAALKPFLRNKRLLVITYNHDIDWILEPALDLEMEIARVCILNYSQDNLFTTRFMGRFEVEESYDQEKRRADIERIQPDILLSNYTSAIVDELTFSDTMPLCPDAGFYSGLEVVKRWAGIFKTNLTEGWKKDAIYFRKYNA